jgi:hypothetical protein
MLVYPGSSLVDVAQQRIANWLRPFRVVAVLAAV